MARFIDDRRPPWWSGLSLLCGAVLVPILAIVLSVREAVSPLGFLAIIGAGLVGLFLLDQRIMGRYRKVVEITAGKAPIRPTGTGKSAVREFREDAFQRALLVVLLLLMICFAVPRLFTRP